MLPTSDPKRAIPLAEFTADLARRRAESGVTEVPRNPGTHRTPSKRALLEAIERAGGKW